MWVNEQLKSKNDMQNPHFARVLEVFENNKVSVLSYSQLLDVEYLTVPGYNFNPKINDTVLVLPVDNRFVCLGIPLKSFSEENCIQSENGGYIKFKTNGDIEINGAVITKDGKFLSN